MNKHLFIVKISLIFFFLSSCAGNKIISGKEAPADSSSAQHDDGFTVDLAKYSNRDNQDQVEVDQNSIVDSTEAYVVNTETIHPHSNEELEKTMEFAGEVRLYQQLSKLRNKLDSNKKKKIKTLALEK